MERKTERRKGVVRNRAELAKKRRKEDPQGYWITNLRIRARKMGLPFNLTKEDLPVPDLCPVLKIPLIFASGGKPTPNSPSADRVDNSKGYIKGNVRIISFKANRAKGDMTLEDAERLVSYMKGEI